MTDRFAITGRLGNKEYQKEHLKNAIIANPSMAEYKPETYHEKTNNKFKHLIPKNKREVVNGIT